MRFVVMPSTVIRRFDYDAPARRLDIQFVTGRRYSYHDVPEWLVDAMRAAQSKAAFSTDGSAIISPSPASNDVRPERPLRSTV